MGKWRKNIKKMQNGQKSLFEGRKRFPGCLIEGFGGGLDLLKWSRNFDLDTRSAIFGNPKTAKTAHFCRFEGTKNGTLGARIKIPTPLLEIQTTPKTPN